MDWSYSDGLPTTLPAALSLGLSGFGLNHFDIGGYTTITVSVLNIVQGTFMFYGLISDCTIRNRKKDGNLLYCNLAVPNVYQSITVFGKFGKK